MSVNVRAAIQQARERAGLTPEGAAAAIGVPVDTYVLWEKGARCPGRSQQAVIAVVLDAYELRTKPLSGPPPEPVRVRRVHSRRYCETGKVMLPSYDIAVAVQRRDKLRRKAPRKLRPYRCGVCKHWHLGGGL